MPSPISLSLLPFLLPFLSLPVGPIDTTGQRAVEARRAAPRVDTRTTDSVARPRPHRAPPSGCVAPALPARESSPAGRADRGRLSRGTFVGESGRIRHVDAHDCNFWGTTELTGAVRRVAEDVAETHPGARLTIGELSKRSGGDIEGHGSHENGLDVDLGFYWLDSRGRPFEPSGFIDARSDRTAVVDGRTLTFDVARNWAIIEAFLTDPEVDLAIVLVNVEIRRWLLDHARAIGVDRRLRRRASIVLRIPGPRAHPHRNHFHLRIFCPESATACRDKNDRYEWVARARARRSRSG